jgi:hypothetical protein
MHRLEAGKVSPEAFDVAFLHLHGARYGETALRRLASQAGPSAARARDALAGKASGPPAPPSGRLVGQIVVRPPGRTLPEDFLHQDWAKQGRGTPPCLRRQGDCTALFVDLNGDGADEIVLKDAGSIGVYRRTSAGWVAVGALAGAVFCADSFKAFRNAPFQAVSPEWRDLEIGGRRYRVDPFHSCK